MGVWISLDTEAPPKQPMTTGSSAPRVPLSIIGCVGITATMRRGVSNMQAKRQEASSNIAAVLILMCMHAWREAQRIYNSDSSDHAPAYRDAAATVIS